MNTGRQCFHMTQKTEIFNKFNNGDRTQGDTEGLFSASVTPQSKEHI